MPEYLTPGVYVEEVSFRAPSIEGVGTSTTGFVGVTRTGPNSLTADNKLRIPQLLTSFGDFQNVYGGYEGLSLSGTDYPNYMAMAVKAFFDNGGSQLYVSRVFAPSSTSGVATSDATAKVVVQARFPGAGGNQTVNIAVKAARTQNIASLPAGSLLASAPNVSALASAVGTVDTQITLAAPLLWGQPAGLRIDAEEMVVTAADTSGTKLTVTRSSPSAHTKGTPVYGQIGSLFKASDSTPTLVITAAPPTTTPAPTTTAGPTTTAAPTTTTAGPTTTTATPTTTAGPTTTTAAPTTPAPTTTAPATATATPPANGIPVAFQVDGEMFYASNVDLAGTTVTVDHSPSAAHAANARVFPALALFANGTTGKFQSKGNSLPAAVPEGLYVLSAQVTANSAAGAAAVYDGLGFDSAHPYYIGTVLSDTPPRHIDGLENQISFTLAGSLTATSPNGAAVFNEIFQNWAGPGANAIASYTLGGGNDGGEPEAPDYDAALDLLQSIDEIAIVGAPGSGVFAESQDIINSLITHVSAQKAYRVAILETPPNQIAGDDEGVRALIDTSYAALYVPWIFTPNPLASAASSVPAEIAVPPTGFMAGIWARNDQQNGVAKAPANEVVLGASRLQRDISFAEQGILNPLGINCIRYFPNRGFRVWGARTASSDTEFMYLNVRRYLVYLEHSIDNSTQWAVFENNGPALWSRVKESVDSFLFNEWKSGNLLGDTAAQAYFVRCDRTTMTQNDLDNGRMICLIGVAVLKPAEFVIFRIGQTIALAQS
jgi:phage tail sheath protein FI